MRLKKQQRLTKKSRNQQSSEWLRKERKIASRLRTANWQLTKRNQRDSKWLKTIEKIEKKIENHLKVFRFKNSIQEESKTNLRGRDDLFASNALPRIKQQRKPVCTAKTLGFVFVRWFSKLEVPMLAFFDDGLSYMPLICRLYASRMPPRGSAKGTAVLLPLLAGQRHTVQPPSSHTIYTGLLRAVTSFASQRYAYRCVLPTTIVPTLWTATTKKTWTSHATSLNFPRSLWPECSLSVSPGTLAWKASLPNKLCSSSLFAECVFSVYPSLL